MASDWRYNAAQVPHLQQAVDADPAIQAAIQAFARLNRPEMRAQLGAAWDRQYRAALDAVYAAVDRNPILREAKVSKDTIRAGFQLNPADLQQGRGTIIREGSDVGHVVRDIILPAAGAGAIVAAPAIIGSQAAGGSGPAGSTVPLASGPAGSAPLAGGAIPGASGAMLAGGPTIGGASAATGGGGALSSILNPRTVGAGLGAISQGQAHNRGEQFGGQLDLARAQIEREQENRLGGADAWRRLLAAQHTLSPGPRPQLSPYSIAPRQATGDERSGAEAMTREVMARLQGGPRELNVDPRLLRPGRGERFLGYAAPILEGVGRVLGY